MANRRVLVKRRDAVRNIRKITRTMQLIATARFQSAFARANASRPYSEKLAEVVGDLAAAAEGIDHPLMRQPEEVDRSALVVISSSRGMCGSFNTNVLNVATEHLDAQAASGVQTDVYMARKKGITYFDFLNREIAERLTEISDMPEFGEIEPIASRLMERFIQGEVASVHVAYTRFVSSGNQTAEIMQLLPLSHQASDDGATKTAVEYEFSPDPKELLEELLPATVRLRLFQAFSDGAISEQIARMVAMKAATDAAEDKIKLLSREYNRARQTAITMELLDIVGGASALA